MFRMMFAAVAALLFALPDADAQVLRRPRVRVLEVQPQLQQDCPGGQCPIVIRQPILTVPLAPPRVVTTPESQATLDWYEVLRVPRGYRLTSEEDSLIRSWARRAVRIING